MSITPLSQAAITVCEQNYGQIGSGCNRCPINKECIDGRVRINEESLKDWRWRIDLAAAKVLESKEATQ